MQTGWFSTHESFVPLDHAVVNAVEIRVPFGQDVMKGAPHDEVGAPLSEHDEDELYRYYNVDSRSPAVPDGATGEPDIRTPHVELVRNDPGTGVPGSARSSSPMRKTARVAGDRCQLGSGHRTYRTQQRAVPRPTCTSRTTSRPPLDHRPLAPPHVVVRSRRSPR